MMGDATRTPKILETTQQLFNKPETSRTLNSIDAIARGAALQSAFLSPAFNTGVFKVEEYNHLPVEVTYGDAGSSETKSAVMFPAKASKCPNKKSITFNNKVGNMNIQLKYAEGAEILQGLPSIIAEYTVPEAKLKHAEKDQASHELAYEIENTLHQIPVLKEANIIEKWQEEEKIAIKKAAPPKPAEAKPEEKKDEAKPAEEAPKDKEAEKPAAADTVQEYETKIKKKQTTSAINFSF
jgi:heat shock protein 4